MSEQLPKCGEHHCEKATDLFVFGHWYCLNHAADRLANHIAELEAKVVLLRNFALYMRGVAKAGAGQEHWVRRCESVLAPADAGEGE